MEYNIFLSFRNYYFLNSFLHSVVKSFDITRLSRTDDIKILLKYFNMDIIKKNRVSEYIKNQ